MGRQYTVKAQCAHDLPQLSPATISGSFSFGAFDAAKQYAAQHLPSYQVIPGGVAYPDCRRFDAINHAAGIGASLWVRELA